MISLAKEVTDAEIEASAKYFSSLKPKSVITVREAETVPKTHVSAWHLVATTTGAQDFNLRPRGPMEAAQILLCH